MPTRDPIIPQTGYPSPGVPLIDIGNTGNDARSLILERMRKAIRGRSNERVKSYEEKQKEMEAQMVSQGKADLFSEPAIIFPGNNVERRPANSVHDIFLLDLDNLQQFRFQFVPDVLNYNPEANFEAIASMARNLPNYHYVGGSDSLTFEVDWFSEQENREDVLLRCKQIEALSRNDGYSKPPPRVKLLWGSTMFSETTWLVRSAPYKLSLPHKQYGYFMQQAYQSITLIKISEENPTVSDILNIAK